MDKMNTERDKIHPLARAGSVITALSLVGCAVSEKATPTKTEGTPIGTAITEVAVPESARVGQVIEALKDWKNFRVDQHPFEMVGQIKIPLNAGRTDLIFLNPTNSDGTPNQQVEYILVGTTLSAEGKDYEVPFLVKIDKTLNSSEAFILQPLQTSGKKSIYEAGEIDENHDAYLAPFQFILDESESIPKFYLTEKGTEKQQQISSQEPSKISQIVSVAFSPSLEQAPISLTPTADISTATPEATATPEIKQFNVCKSEQLFDCQITREDLTSGDYLRWLYTLSKPFDPAKIKDVPLVDFGGVVIYDTTTAPNFEGKGSEPFRRDVTTAYMEFIDDAGETRKYVVLPIEFYDKDHPDKNQWVITVFAAYYPGHDISKGSLLYAVKVWKESMNLTPILTTAIIPFANTPDPLVAETFNKFPDMQQRFRDFIGQGKTGQQNLASLSEPGIILQTKIVKTEGEFYR